MEEGVTAKLQASENVAVTKSMVADKAIHVQSASIGTQKVAEQPSDNVMLSSSVIAGAIDVPATDANDYVCVPLPRLNMGTKQTQNPYSDSTAKSGGGQDPHLEAPRQVCKASDAHHTESAEDRIPLSFNGQPIPSIMSVPGLNVVSHTNSPICSRTCQVFSSGSMDQGSSLTSVANLASRPSQIIFVPGPCSTETVYYTNEPQGSFNSSKPSIHLETQSSPAKSVLTCQTLADVNAVNPVSLPLVQLMNSNQQINFLQLPSCPSQIIQTSAKDQTAPNTTCTSKVALDPEILPGAANEDKESICKNNYVDSSGSQEKRSKTPLSQETPFSLTLVHHPHVHSGCKTTEQSYQGDTASVLLGKKSDGLTTLHTQNSVYEVPMYLPQKKQDNTALQNSHQFHKKATNGGKEVDNHNFGNAVNKEMARNTVPISNHLSGAERGHSTVPSAVSIFSDCLAARTELLLQKQSHPSDNPQIPSIGPRRSHITSSLASCQKHHTDELNAKSDVRQETSLSKSYMPSKQCILVPAEKRLSPSNLCQVPVQQSSKKMSHGSVVNNTYMGNQKVIHQIQRASNVAPTESENISKPALAAKQNNILPSIQSLEKKPTSKVQQNDSVLPLLSTEKMSSIVNSNEGQHIACIKETKDALKHSGSSPQPLNIDEIEVSEMDISGSKSDESLTSNISDMVNRITSSGIPLSSLDESLDQETERGPKLIESSSLSPNLVVSEEDNSKSASLEGCEAFLKNSLQSMSAPSVKSLILQLFRLPYVENCSEYYIPWGEIKEVLFPLCQDENCNLLLRAAKEALENNFASVNLEHRARSISRNLTEADVLHLAQQFFCVPLGCVAFNLESLRSSIQKIYTQVYFQHQMVLACPKRIQQSIVYSDSAHLSDDVEPVSDISSRKMAQQISTSTSTCISKKEEHPSARRSNAYDPCKHSSRTSKKTQYTDTDSPNDCFIRGKVRFFGEILAGCYLGSMPDCKQGTKTLDLYIPVADLARCFPLMVDYLTKLCRTFVLHHSIKYQTVKSSVHGVGLRLGTPSEARELTLWRAQLWTTQPTDRSWRYLTSHSILINWNDFRPVINRQLSLAERRISSQGKSDSPTPSRADVKKTVFSKGRNLETSQDNLDLTEASTNCESVVSDSEHSNTSNVSRGKEEFLAKSDIPSWNSHRKGDEHGGICAKKTKEKEVKVYTCKRKNSSPPINEIKRKCHASSKTTKLTVTRKITPPTEDDSVFDSGTSEVLRPVVKNSYSSPKNNINNTSMLQCGRSTKVMEEKICSIVPLKDLSKVSTQGSSAGVKLKRCPGSTCLVSMVQTDPSAEMKTYSGTLRSGTLSTEDRRQNGSPISSNREELLEYLPPVMLTGVKQRSLRDGKKDDVSHRDHGHEYPADSGKPKISSTLDSRNQEQCLMLSQKPASLLTLTKTGADRWNTKSGVDKDLRQADSEPIHLDVSTTNKYPDVQSVEIQQSNSAKPPISDVSTWMVPESVASSTAISKCPLLSTTEKSTLCLPSQNPQFIVENEDNENHIVIVENDKPSRNIDSYAQNNATERLHCEKGDSFGAQNQYELSHGNKLVDPKKTASQTSSIPEIITLTSEKSSVKHLLMSNNVTTQNLNDAGHPSKSQCFVVHSAQGNNSEQVDVNDVPSTLKLPLKSLPVKKYVLVKEGQLSNEEYAKDVITRAKQVCTCFKFPTEKCFIDSLPAKKRYSKLYQFNCEHCAVHGDQRKYALDWNRSSANSAIQICPKEIHLPSGDDMYKKKHFKKVLACRHSGHTVSENPGPSACYQNTLRKSASLGDELYAHFELPYDSDLLREKYIRIGRWQDTDTPLSISPVQHSPVIELLDGELENHSQVKQTAGLILDKKTKAGKKAIERPKSLVEEQKKILEIIKKTHSHVAIADAKMEKQTSLTKSLLEQEWIRSPTTEEVSSLVIDIPDLNTNSGSCTCKNSSGKSHKSDANRKMCDTNTCKKLEKEKHFKCNSTKKDSRKSDKAGTGVDVETVDNSNEMYPEETNSPKFMNKSRPIKHSGINGSEKRNHIHSQTKGSGFTKQLFTMPIDVKIKNNSLQCKNSENPEFRFTSCYDEETGESKCGFLHIDSLVMPFVLRNGYKFFLVKDACKLFPLCRTGCSIPRKILTKTKILCCTMCSFDEVYLMDLIWKHRGTSVCSGDLLIRLDTTLKLLHELQAKVQDEHIRSKNKKSAECNY